MIQNVIGHLGNFKLICYLYLVRKIAVPPLGNKNFQFPCYLNALKTQQNQPEQADKLLTYLT